MNICGRRAERLCLVVITIITGIIADPTGGKPLFLV
jgi:hypothetical protein